jgi:Fur family ferric uptake transcriptional regulator
MNRETAISQEEAQRRYGDFLDRNKMFFTKERILIVEAVYLMEGHFSADELLFEMQKRNMRVSRATLYRSLSQLVDCGVLVEADFGHGHTHYELVGTEPHEHLVCQQCGKVVEVVSQEFSQSIRNLAQGEGFRLISHRTYIAGICPDCQAAGS